MSNNSGFQNRQQLQQYEQLLQLLLITLNKRLVKFYQNEECDELAFRNIFHRIISGMKSLEKQKFMPPRFSETVRNLFEILKLEEQHESDRLYMNPQFDLISRQANIIMNQDKKPTQNLQHLQQDDHQEMPPHPLMHIDQRQDSTKLDMIFEKVDKQDKLIKLEQIDKSKKYESGITETTTPRKFRESLHQQQFCQQQQFNLIPKEFINQIEECVTRNVLDKLSLPKKSKKKKQRSSSNQFQFRQILLTTSEKQNQSFQSTKRKFNNLI
ncbi:unnamed protein product [Paramecium pentaurelia]|uniref:Uncharacterized protein n=1 Tax=Paramecium pentaurelia TaxID=43138 RepID=A0A8S1TCM7_9CILI|nr:unnamed protein product [Paramecium pentaurelia]